MTANLFSRAKIEENYGRELIKLSKQFPVKDEIGSVFAYWWHVEMSSKVIKFILMIYF